MFEKLCALIAEQFGVEADTVTADTSFVDELGADSVDLVDLAMALEEAVGVKIEDSALAEMKTVGDVLKYLESHNA